MQNVIDRLLSESPGAKPEHLGDSGWLYDAPPEVVESAIAEYGRLYSLHLAELRSLLGEPVSTDATHRAEIGRWYPEAIRAACWSIGNKTLCLALEQHDREAPVAVLLRCLTADEVAELSA